MHTGEDLPRGVCRHSRHQARSHWGELQPLKLASRKESVLQGLLILGAQWAPPGVFNQHPGLAAFPEFSIGLGIVSGTGIKKNKLPRRNHSIKTWLRSRRKSEDGKDRKVESKRRGEADRFEDLMLPSLFRERPRTPGRCQHARRREKSAWSWSEGSMV